MSFQKLYRAQPNTAQGMIAVGDIRLPSHHHSSCPAYGSVIPAARALTIRFEPPRVRSEGYRREAGIFVARAFGGDRPAACPRELRQGA